MRLLTLSLMLVLLLAVFLIFATHDGFFLHHSHTEILIFTRIQIKLQSGHHYCFCSTTFICLAHLHFTLSQLRDLTKLKFEKSVRTLFFLRLLAMSNR